MAASIDWRQVLNKHRIFKQLQSCLGKVKPEIESKSILTIHDGQLFVWNAYNSTILTINLKLLVGKSETEISEDTFQVISLFQKFTLGHIIPLHFLFTSKFLLCIYIFVHILVLPCYQLSPDTNYRHQRIKHSYFSNGHIF